jgi:Zn-finger protein
MVSVGDMTKSIVRGSDKSCEYYPCHIEGQDCTWCYCPFYPCLDGETGGRFKRSSSTGRDVWSCIDCRWIHREEVARAVADLIEEASNSDKALHAIRRRLLGVYG